MSMPSVSVASMSERPSARPRRRSCADHFTLTANAVTAPETRSGSRSSRTQVSHRPHQQVAPPWPPHRRCRRGMRLKGRWSPGRPLEDPASCNRPDCLDVLSGLFGASRMTPLELAATNVVQRLRPVGGPWLLPEGRIPPSLLPAAAWGSSSSSADLGRPAENLFGVCMTTSTMKVRPLSSCSSTALLVEIGDRLRHVGCGTCPHAGTPDQHAVDGRSRSIRTWRAISRIG